jgi:hypothetical protein
MKKTSASVIALLLATTKAVKLNKVPGYETVDDEAEGVHVLDLGMHTMSNSPKSFPEMAFPNIRTAFYLQTDVEEGEFHYDQQNQLYRKKTDPVSPENYDPWVYEISKKNMGNFPQWHWEKKQAEVQTGRNQE